MKKISLVFVVLIVSVLFVSDVGAQVTPPTQTTRPNTLRISSSTRPRIASTTPIVSNTESCFDYYHFQSVQVSVGPENESYKAGDSIRFVGELINQNPYPVVDGYVFVRIGNKNPKYIQEGQNVVDEIFALGPLTIDASSSIPVSFYWNVPKAIKSGEYRADYSFSVGKRFNLGGLPFTNEIVIGFADFNITDGRSGTIVFDKSSTTVNGDKYNHIGNWPYADKGQESIIKQSIKNTEARDKRVQVQYDLFWWDSLNEADKISTKTETVLVKGNSSTVLSYKLPPADQSVYYLRITATTEDGQKSIVNIRTLTVGVPRPRGNYPAITQFPLQEGDTATLFSCYHNASDSSTAEGRLEVTLKDIKGNIIATTSYTGEITGAMSVTSSKFTATKDLTYLTLEEKLYDKNNTLIESYTSTYDCSTLDSKACHDMTDVNWTLVFALIITSIIIILVAYILHKRNPQPHHPHMWSFALFIALLGIVIVTIAYLTKPVWAETVSPDGKTKSETVSTSAFVSFTIEQGVGSTHIRPIANYTHTAQIDKLTLPIGDNLTAGYSSEGTFNGFSGTIDTPYFGEILNITYTPIEYEYNGYDYTVTAPIPTVSLVSSDPTILSCTDMSCSALNPGQAIISANISSTVATRSIWFCPFTGPYWWEYTSCAEAEAHIPPLGDSSWEDDVEGYSRSLISTSSTIIPGYSPSWTITVTAGTSTPATSTVPVAPILSATKGNCGTGVINLSWNATATTTNYRIYKDGSTDALNTITTNSYSDTNSASSTHSYYVISHNEVGDSVPSNTVTIQAPGNCPNQPPLPPTITGTTIPVINTSNTYNIVSTDPDGNQIKYGIDWSEPADEVIDQWLPAGGLFDITGYINSGTSQSTTKSWSTLGTHSFKALAIDSLGFISTWSTYNVNVTAIPPTAIGQCGSAIGLYSSTDTSFRSPLCNVGSPITTPSFPAPGSSVTWICNSSGGNSPQCTATRDSVSAGPLDLRIGRTVANASSSLNLPVGQTFALSWIVPSGMATSSCTVSTTPPPINSWNGIWQTSVSGGNSAISAIPTTGNSLGFYTLGMQCSNSTHTATSTDSVLLRLTESSIIEI